MAPTVPGEAGCCPPARFLLDLSTSELLGLDACWSGDLGLVVPVLHGAARAGPATRARSATALARRETFIKRSSRVIRGRNCQIDPRVPTQIPAFFEAIG